MIDLSDTQKLCVFRAGPDWFAVPVAAVREIADCPAISLVTAGAGVTAGLVHFRNSFIPVVRLPGLLSEPDGTGRLEPLLLILVGVEGDWGLAVDEIAGLETLEITRSDHRDSFCEDTPIAGWTSHRNGAVRVLDAVQLYRLAEAGVSQGEHALTGATMEAGF